MIELTVAVISVLLFSAVASGVEAAIFSLPISKAKSEKGRIGKYLSEIKDKPARPISTIVIFNNLSNIVGTFIVAALATKVLSPTAMFWFPWLLTISIILFAEILPKTLGERHSLPILKLTVMPLVFFTWILSPAVFLIEKFTSYFNRGQKPTTSEIEIRLLATMGCEEGVIEYDEAEHLHRIFEMNDQKATDIMTPRTALTWLRGSEILSDVKAKVGMSQHSRILIVGETLDDVKGILLKNKVLELLTTGADESQTIDSFIEPVESFSEDTLSDELLDYFKTSRVHLVVIKDEYGGTSGVVTLEDVLEVLTGEIIDETDIHVDLQQEALKHGRKRLGINAGKNSKTRSVGKRVQKTI